MQSTPVIFGSDLDFLDSPERVCLKQAFIAWQSSIESMPGLPRGPYHALTPFLKSRISTARLQGPLDVPGWLSPRPGPEDAELVISKAYRDFMDSGDHAIYVEQCGRAAMSALPDVPLLIAVDHSMSAGPITALSRRLGPERLAAVVLDSHFDAIPPSLRSAHSQAGEWDGAGLCGSFLAGLLDRGVIIPSQLFVVGLCDMPPEGAAGPFADEYRRLLDMGVKVYPASAARGPGFTRTLVSDMESTPADRLYVSLDADVGACSCTSAVRFMDSVGLGERELTRVARALGALVERGRFHLSGADVAEIDVHLLGLAGPDGSADRTLDVCADFLAALFGVCHDH